MEHLTAYWNNPSRTLLLDAELVVLSLIAGGFLGTFMYECCKVASGN